MRGNGHINQDVCGPDKDRTYFSYGVVFVSSTTFEFINVHYITGGTK